jgi:hypothetical protein
VFPNDTCVKKVLGLNSALKNPSDALHRKLGFNVSDFRHKFALFLERNFFVLK